MSNNHTHQTATSHAPESIRSRDGGQGRGPARRRPTWRVVDIVVAAVVSAACAVVFWMWSNVLYPVASTIAVAYPPLSGLLGGGWLIGGTLGALLVRKPGAAIFCEVLAAVLQGFLGTGFGWTVLYSGLIQGAAVEMVFLLTRYRRFGLGMATLAGAVSGLAMGVSEDIMYNFAWAFDQQVAYAAFTTISGAVLAGALMWFVMRALQATGVLSGLASGATRR